MIAPTDGRMVIMTLPRQLHDFAVENRFQLKLIPKGFNDEGAEIVAALPRDKDNLALLVRGPKLPLTPKGGKVPETLALLSDYVQ